MTVLLLLAAIAMVAGILRLSRRVGQVGVAFPCAILLASLVAGYVGDGLLGLLLCVGVAMIAIPTIAIGRGIGIFVGRLRKHR